MTMMPSDCHWRENDMDADCKSSSAIPQLQQKDDFTEECCASEDPEKYYEWCSGADSGTEKLIEIPQTYACDAVCERIEDEYACDATVSCKSCVSIEDFGACVQDVEYSHPVIKPHSDEGSPASAASHIDSFETVSAGSSETVWLSPANCYDDVRIRLHSLEHQNDACSETEERKVAFKESEDRKGVFNISNLSIEQPVFLCLTSGSNSLSVIPNVNRHNTTENGSETPTSEHTMAEKCDRTNRRQHDLNTNADTDNASVDSEVPLVPPVTVSDHDQTVRGQCAAQISDGSLEPTHRVEQTQSSLDIEQRSVNGSTPRTSSSDVRGVAHSLGVGSDSHSTADIDSLPASELASVVSGLSIDTKDCTECLPLLSAMSLEQNSSELSDSAADSKDCDSLPLVSALQLEQTSVDCTGGEQAYSADSSVSLVSVDVSDIPDEVFLKVFSFLKPAELCGHVTRVCKRWHCLAYDHSLWKKLDVSSVRLSGLQLCQLVLRTSGALRHLDMSGMDHISNAEMAVVAENCPHLTHLDLGFVDDLTCPMLHAILTSCPRLQFLNVEGCRNANHEMMRVLAATAGPELKQLNFSHCSLVDESLWVLMQGVHGVTHLNIDGISWISELVIQHLATKYCDSLQSWELDGNEMTDNTIQSVSVCHRLSILSVSFCEHLSDLSLSYLQRLERLAKLSLRKGPSFSSAALVEFLSSSSVANLTYIDLTECQQLEDEGVQSIAQTCGPKLKTLVLSWCWDVTDKGMEYVATLCKSMVSMYLVGLHRLEGLWLATAITVMPHLLYISFEQCNEVVDMVIEEAVRDKPDLVILNYYGELFMHKSSP